MWWCVHSSQSMPRPKHEPEFGFRNQWEKSREVPLADSMLLAAFCVWMSGAVAESGSGELVNQSDVQRAPSSPPVAPPSLHEYCMGEEHQCTCESLGKIDATLEECVAYGAGLRMTTRIRTDFKIVSGCSSDIFGMGLLIFNMARVNASLLTSDLRWPICWNAPSPSQPPAAPSPAPPLVPPSTPSKTPWAAAASALAGLVFVGLALMGVFTKGDRQTGAVRTATVQEMQKLRPSNV